MNKQTSSPPNRMTGQSMRWIVGLTGLVVFLLLFFADKSNLTNQESTGISATTSPATAGQGLPPLAPDPDFDRWQAALPAAKAAERVALLDSMIRHLEGRRRYEYAADYAEERARLDSSLDARLRAGQLSHLASQSFVVQQDSALFRRYSAQAIAQLAQVVEMAPENEEGLLYLGLALTLSGVPQNSMQGILTIRKVLEINPANTEAAYQLGLFSLQTGQYEKAEARFRQVLASAPDHQAARLQLAATLTQLDQPEAARPLLTEVLQQAEDPELKREARALLDRLPAR